MVRHDLFFFQAEDGIRDGTVTGVQTCALPIYRIAERAAAHPPRHAGTPSQRLREGLFALLYGPAARIYDRFRSEERRVGKEWRCRGARDREKKEGGC